MPSLLNRRMPLRILIVGDPGAGKTGAIGNLAEHGQELFWADFDNNLNALPQFLSPEALGRIHVETLVDPVRMNAEGKPIIDGIPPSLPQFIKLSDKWVDSETGEDFGRPEEWADDRWFVVDSLTTLGNACMNYTMFKRKKMGRRRGFAEWGDAIERVEGVMQRFAGADVNVIMTAHLCRLNMEDVTETDDSNDRPTQAKRLPPNATMRYPVALGQKLPPRIGGYFNVVLQLQRIGTGAGAQRLIRTVPEEDVDIKVPLPPRIVKPEVKIDRLWDIIKPLKEARNNA